MSWPPSDKVMDSEFHRLERGGQEPSFAKKFASESSDSLAISPQNFQVEPGASWIASEVESIPKNNLLLVGTGLMLILFIAALDQTMIGIILPTMSNELNGGNQFHWVGSAYLLASAATAPIYGKLSDIFGRKPLLHGTVALFIFGTGLGGAAQSMGWLIACRVLQGAGGGGIIQMVLTVTSDILPLNERAKWGGYIGATWGVANLVGPTMGGLITDRASWRWCFWFPLPIGVFASILLIFTLNLNPHGGESLRYHLTQFDALGLALIIGGVACALLGLTFSQTRGEMVLTIAMTVVGACLLLAAAIWEVFTKRSPIIPPRLFQTRTTAVILLVVFVHGFAYFAGYYYLPIYFEVLEGSATKAGIRMLSFTMGGAVSSSVIGLVVTLVGDVRVAMWSGMIAFTLGMGLMTMLDETSSIVETVLTPLIAGLGMGCLFEMPLVALQAAMPAKDMATSTAAFTVVRLLGGALGVAVGQAVSTNVLGRTLSGISEIPVSQVIEQARFIADPATKRLVQQAVTRSISAIWIVCPPLLGVGLLTLVFMRKYSLEPAKTQTEN